MLQRRADVAAFAAHGSLPDQVASPSRTAAAMIRS